MRIIRIFGKELSNARKSSSLTQSELAKLSKLDRTYISLLERGLRQPTLTTLFVLSSALKVEPSELVARVQSKLKSKQLLLLKRKAY